MNLFKQGIAVGNTDSFQLSSTAQSFEVTNMSRLDLLIIDPIMGGFRLPAFAGRSFEGQPGQTIDFSLVNPLLTANPQSGEYIQVTDSTTKLVTPVTPLALIPIYNMPITGTVQIGNASVPVSGTMNANITNASLTVGSITQTVNTTGTAQVTNSFVADNSLVLLNSFTFALNLAAGATTGEIYNGDFSGVVGLYDGIIVVVQSPSTSHVYQVNEYVTNKIAFLYGQVGASAAPYTQTRDFNVSYCIGYLPTPKVFNTLAISLTNMNGVAVNETVNIWFYGIKANVNITNPSTSPVNTQGVFTSTSFVSMSNAQFNDTIAPNGVGAMQYTNSLDITGAKGVQVYYSVNTAIGYSSSAGLQLQMQVSSDNANWFDVAGDATFPSKAAVTVSGTSQAVFDQTLVPMLTAGYKYLRFRVYQYNNGAGSVTLSNAGTYVTFIMQKNSIAA